MKAIVTNGQAEYIFENDHEKISFRHAALSVKKCIQIKKLAENDKLWKGYCLISISFNIIDGLNKLRIKKVKSKGPLVIEIFPNKVEIIQD